MDAATSRETILVVDDEPQVLVALEDLLCDEFLVLKSESAERALHLVEQDPNIAVVVSDQRMPRMHGDELFRRLRARFGAERILSTGFADLSAVIRAVNEGQIFAYVTKPWDPEDLRVKVQRAADHFRLNRELAQERKLLEDLMNSMPDPIYFKGADLKFQRVNAALLPLLGASSASQVIGRTLLELFNDPATAMALEAQEHALLAEHGTQRDRLTQVTMAGASRWFSTTKASILDRAGEAVGLVGIARDVTARVNTEEALRSREEQLRLIFAASSAGLFDWDLVQDTVTYSPSFVPNASQSPSGKTSFAELERRVHPDDLAPLRSALELHLSERSALRGFELRVKLGDEYRWFEVNAQAVWDVQGRATRLVGSSTDITERKQQEERIRRLTRTYAVLSGIDATILRVHERSALLTECCSIAVRVGEIALAVVTTVRRGPEPGSAASRPLELVAWDGTSEALAQDMAAWLVAQSETSDSAVLGSIATGAPMVFNDLRHEGSLGLLAPLLLDRGHSALAILPVLASGRVNCVISLVADQAGFFDEDQVKLLSKLADNIGFALEHTAQAEQLKFLAYYDELTELANRRLLADRLTQQLTVCAVDDRRVAVALLDVERFRHVNETLGRSAGDQVLLELTRRLRTIADGKWTLARYASNTFAATLGPLDDESHVAQWIEQALAVLRQSVVVSDTELRLSARVGIALFPADGRDADTLLSNAEAALQNAKASAQRYLFYTSAMNGRVAERLKLETRLRSAIEHSEFLLHYQPKVELKTGRTVGLEALIRWAGSDGKLIPPGVFIPLLEETGLIVEVGKWVIERAAAQHEEWYERGLESPRIAVNVSPLQLAQADFTQTLDAILDKYPHARTGIDLEITESVLMEDLTGNTEKLRRAKNSGLGVAIDDFGTGYSSLGYLSRLPIDALKIDRSFVMRMTDDPQEMSIVTTIISLAHALDLKVIAEGVETTQQAQLLRLLKCDQIQGYLVARPQAAESVVGLLSGTFDFSGRNGA